MTLLERVKAAGNGRPLDVLNSRDALLAMLKDQVEQIVSADTLAAIMADNPERARNEVRSACRQAFESDAWAAVSAEKRTKLVDNLIDAVFGLGPLEELLADETITEVLVNGSKSIYYEQGGVLHKSDFTFSDDDQVRALIDRIIGPLGRRIDESSPMVNARLPQGHRVNAIIPPLALDGPMLSIRAFTSSVMTLDDMMQMGAFDEYMRQFLIWLVLARKNVAVSGGTGSGKTTLLNALSCFISHSERVITIEDSAELRFLEHPHVVRLEARSRNAEGTGEVTIRELVINALRMRPDRIIVGECRGGEALDMMQAMNTGHDGSLTTLHANSPAEAVGRLVIMVRFATELPVDAIETQIASALDVVVQTARTIDGERFVSEAAEVVYDRDKRLCVTKTIYKREPHVGKGTWFYVPRWIDELPLQGIATEKEVRLWKQGRSLAA